MSSDRLERLQTWLLRLLLVTVLGIVLVVGLGVYQGQLSTAKVARLMGQLLELPGLPRPYVTLIAGHRGFDTGAMCDDGLMEVMITEEVARLVAADLRREGVRIEVLDEYAAELNGLRRDALVSIHVDSCVPLSGFKVTSAEVTEIPQKDARLVQCLLTNYREVTGLRIHPNTQTSDMYGYHAFQRVTTDTPGAIIEIGFLGGDRDLLTENPDLAAAGIVKGILCYVESEYVRPTPSPTSEPAE